MIQWFLKIDWCTTQGYTVDWTTAGKSFSHFSLCVLMNELHQQAKFRLMNSSEIFSKNLLLCNTSKNMISCFHIAVYIFSFFFHWPVFDDDEPTCVILVHSYSVIRNEKQIATNENNVIFAIIYADPCCINFCSIHDSQKS